MLPGILWRFSWTLPLNRCCKHFPTSQNFILANKNYKLDKEQWCSFGKGAIIEGISTICLPTFFPTFWRPITTNCHRVVIIFPIKFKLIRFDIWINCRTLLFIITVDCHRVMIIFPINFKLINFDIWINCRTLLFGLTQIGIRFSTCKVQL